MKNAVKKCKEKNMNVSSPKKLINIIAKNLGLSLNKINEEKKNENNQENKSDKSSKDISLVENNQMIEIDIEDTKETNFLSTSNKQISSDNIKQDKNNYNFLKKHFLSQEVPETNMIKMTGQLKKNDVQEVKKLSEILLNKNKQKVIILILIELICFTVLNPSNYITKKSSLEIGFKLFNTFNSNSRIDFIYISFYMVIIYLIKRSE
jgi:hypothetical protein